MARDPSPKRQRRAPCGPASRRPRRSVRAPHRTSLVGPVSNRRLRGPCSLSANVAAGASPAVVGPPPTAICGHPRPTGHAVGQVVIVPDLPRRLAEWRVADRRDLPHSLPTPGQSRALASDAQRLNRPHVNPFYAPAASRVVEGTARSAMLRTSKEPRTADVRRPGGRPSPVGQQSRNRAAP